VIVIEGCGVVGAGRCKGGFTPLGADAELGTRGACSGSDADLGNGGGVMLRGVPLTTRCVGLTVSRNLTRSLEFDPPKDGADDEMLKGRPAT